MKRLASLLLSVLLLCALSGPAFAAEEELVTYEIEEGGFSIALPASYDVLTRNMSRDDPVLTHYEETYDELMDYLEENDAYLDALNEDESLWIVAYLAPGPLMDFRRANSEELMEFCAASEEKLTEDSGLSAVHAEILEFSDQPFVQISYETSSANIALQQVITVRNGQFLSINFSFLNESPLTENPEELMHSILETLEFGQETVWDRAAPYVRFFLPLLLSPALLIALFFIYKRHRKKKAQS